MNLTFLSQLWVQRLGWTLVHFLWQGTVIAILYAAIRGLLGRWLSAQGRYVLASLALAAMTVAPVLTFLLIPKAGGAGPVVSWNISAAGWQRLLPGVVAAWLLGVVAFSIRLFGGWRFTERLRSVSHPAPPEWQRTLERIAARVGASRPVRLLVSSLVEVPTVIGWLRPVILVPVDSLTGLHLEHITALLAHELAHIRRHDYLASVLQSIAEAVLFYHPAVWWVSEQIRAERELCCDDLAVAASGDVLTYARALAELESQISPRLRPALAANGGSLVNRIRRLIEPTRPAANNLPGPGAAWAMSLLWLAGIGVATVHAAQAPAPRVADFHPVLRTPQSIPAPALARPALNALLYDPFLPAPQVAIPQATPNTPASGAQEKKIRVEGRVISQTGEAVPRATVALGDGKTVFGSPIYSQTSDDAGRFVFDDVAPGSYKLQVTKTGFLDGAYGAQWVGAFPPAFTLQAGQTMKDVVIKLTPQGVITGQVTNQDGDPVAHVTVTAHKVAYVRGRKSLQPGGGGGQTDDEGKYRIAGLTQGRYYIDTLPQNTVVAARISSQPAAADVQTMYPSALDLAGATPLDVAPGARLDRMDIRLRREPVYTVKGTVTMNGSPAEARVTVSPKDANSSSPRWSAPAIQGAFEVRGVPPGRYVLAAFLGNETRTVIINAAGPPPPAQPGPFVRGRSEVTVADSNLDGVVVALEPDLEISGTFRAEDGDLQDLAKSATPPEPPADPYEAGMLGGASTAAGLGLYGAQTSNLKPMLRLYSDDGSGQVGGVALMKDDGTFRISGSGLAPGRYTWDITNLADSIYVKSVSYDGVDATHSTINVMAGGKLEIVLSGKAGSIAGTLHNDKNEPLTGVTVTVWPKNFGAGSPSYGVRSKSTDQNAGFKIGGLAPGDYYVAAWEGEAANSGLIASPDFLGAFMSEAATVTLGEGLSANADVKLISRVKIAAAAAKIP